MPRAAMERDHVEDPLPVYALASDDVAAQITWRAHTILGLMPNDCLAVGPAQACRLARLEVMGPGKVVVDAGNKAGTFAGVAIQIRERYPLVIAQLQPIPRLDDATLWPQEHVEAIRIAQAILDVDILPQPTCRLNVVPGVPHKDGGAIWLHGATVHALLERQANRDRVHRGGDRQRANITLRLAREAIPSGSGQPSAWLRP
mmetsp:Transcript_114122/g.329649  ORF Transcript_114122/g.329649 Transcript_114122/m.329649 type:complete len:202 (+) Transcript_114122:259-864(+)